MESWIFLTLLLAGSSGVQVVQGSLSLDNESELREAQAALFNSNSNQGWVLLDYTGPSTVRFSNAGEGTTSEFVDRLEDDQVQYVLVRLPIQGKPKRDIFIEWIGPSVGIIEKGKKSGWLGDAQSILQPFHAAVTVLNRDNLNDETLAEKSNPSGSMVID